MSEEAEFSLEVCSHTHFSALCVESIGNFHYATWNLFCHREKIKRSLFEMMVYNLFFVFVF